MKKTTNILLILFIVIAGFLLFHSHRDNQSKDLVIQKLDRQNDSLTIKINHGLQLTRDLTRQRGLAEVQAIKTDSVYKETVKKKDAQIAYYRAHPKIVEIVKQNPIVDSAFRAYDSALVTKDNRIGQLQAELYSTQKLAVMAQQNFDNVVRDYQLTVENAQKQAEHYRSQMHKERKKKKAAIIGGITLAFLALLI